jgi:hypothetical protein
MPQSQWRKTEWAWAGPRGSAQLGFLCLSGHSILPNNCSALRIGCGRITRCIFAFGLVKDKLQHGKAPQENLHERVALAVTARSPIKRLLEFKKERGWQNLQIYSDSHLSKRWQVFKLHNRRLDSVEGSSKRFTGSRVNEGLNGSCALGEIAERLAP